MILNIDPMLPVCICFLFFLMGFALISWSLASLRQTRRALIHVKIGLYCNGRISPSILKIIELVLISSVIKQGCLGCGHRQWHSCHLVCAGWREEGVCRWSYKNVWTRPWARQSKSSRGYRRGHSWVHGGCRTARERLTENFHLRVNRVHIILLLLFPVLHTAHSNGISSPLQSML